MQSIIIAAGQGTRLWARTRQVPKTLLPFGRGTILSHILESLRAAGASRFRVVVGFRAPEIIAYLRGHADWRNLVSCVENPEWRRGNALSVLRGAQGLVSDQAPALLSMSDHLVPTAALRKVVEHPGSRNLLLVDRHIDRVFDPPDATRVLLEGRRIVAIGKDLVEYNGIDCGVFRINGRMLSAIAANAVLGREGISDAARELISQDDLEAVDFPDGLFWIDVDTPEAYRHACAHADRFGPSRAP